MEIDSDSDSDNRVAAKSSRTKSRQRTASTSTEAATGTGSTTISSENVTKRERLEKAKEEGYAQHIASLQNVEDLPSGWISATRAVKRRTNGKFRRPDEEPPITGYSWNNQHGVWVPSVRFVQETSFVSKISTKKAPNTSTSRSKALPSPSPAQASVVSRSKPFLKWTNIDETLEPSKRASTTMMEKRAVRDMTLKSKTNPEVETPIEPLPRASRKRRTSHTENSDEKRPPRSNRKEKKSIDLNMESDQPDEESSVGIVVNESSKSAIAVDASSPPVNIERKRSHHRKKPADDAEDDNYDENEFHPNSMWQEPYTDDLTMYERHRTARPVPKGTILFHMDAIRPEIRCAICLDILQNTRIVRECLHRFCESCIEQALTFQNVEAVGGRRKECPICRVYIPSRRSLAPDTYMDTLVSRLLDNLIWEEDNDPAVYLRSPQKSTQRLITQQSTRNDNNYVESETTVGSDSKTMDTVEKNDHTTPMQIEAQENQADEKVPIQLHPKNAMPDLIKVVLIQQPDPITKQKYFDDLHQPYLTLTSDAPGSVLRTFICRKMNTTDSFNNFKHHEHDKERTSDSINPNLLLLWTMYRLEPYLINTNDTLQYLISNRTDPFQGRYMPIYYRYTG